MTKVPGHGRTNPSAFQSDSLPHMKQLVLGFLVFLRLIVLSANGADISSMRMPRVMEMAGGSIGL
jgi:hypothetical protein